MTDVQKDKMSSARSNEKIQFLGAALLIFGRMALCIGLAALGGYFLGADFPLWRITAGIFFGLLLFVLGAMALNSLTLTVFHELLMVSSTWASVIVIAIIVRIYFENLPYNLLRIWLVFLSCIACIVYMTIYHWKNKGSRTARKKKAKH